MKIYASSDTHYFHDNIIKYCNRPFDGVEHMNREMINRWNSIVNPDDIVLHIGDVSAGLKGRADELVQLIKGLHGKKILIRGNHDHLPDSWYVEAGFLNVVPYLEIDSNLFVHHPIGDAVKFHPSLDWDKKRFIIHGHIHRTDIPNFQDHFNVAVDRNEFFPVDLSKIITNFDIFKEKMCSYIDNL